MKKRYMKPWPLERAELIQRTERHRRDETARADAAIAAANEARRYARQEALEALVKGIAKDGNLIEMTFRHAHQELAKMAGQDVAAQVEKMWGYASQEQEFKRQAVDVAVNGMKIDVRAHTSLADMGEVVVTKFQFEHREFFRAVMVPNPW